MNKEQKRERIKELNAEKIKVNERVETICASVKQAFSTREERSLRELSAETGISLGTLSEWFRNTQNDGSHDEQKRRTDGPRMIYLVSLTKALNIALPGTLDFDKVNQDYPLPPFASSPDAWNVFIQNMKAVRNVVLLKERETLREVGGIPKSYEKKSKDDNEENPIEMGKEIRDDAKAISKYYRRIVNPKSNEKQTKIKNLKPEELTGNPFCELKTLVAVTNRLNPEENLSKWFQRWCESDMVCSEYREILLHEMYSDELEKLQLLAPYIIGGTQESMAAVRVGRLEDMERNYPQTKRIIKESKDEKRFILDVKKKLVRGTSGVNGIRTNNWETLYETGFVREGDLLVACEVKKKIFGNPQVVVFNITQTPKEEILDYLEKRGERKDAYKSIRVASNPNGRQYSILPDGETIEQFYQKDFLSLYHTLESEERKYEEKKFHLNPREICEDRWNGTGFDHAEKNEEFTKNVLNNVRMESLMIEEESNTDEVKQNREDYVIDGFKVEIVERMDNLQKKRMQKYFQAFLVDYSVRFGYCKESNVYLRYERISGDSVELRVIIDPEEVAIGDQSQHAPKTVMVVSWSIEDLIEKLADKAEEVLCKHGFDAESIEEYKLRIREQGIRELIKTDRLWLEILFPKVGDGRIQWYWHFDYCNTVMD